VTARVPFRICVIRFIGTSEAYPPLIVHADAVLAFAVARQCFQTIARQSNEIAEQCCRLSRFELQTRRALKARETLDSMASREIPHLLVSKAGKYALRQSYIRHAGTTEMASTLRFSGDPGKLNPVMSAEFMRRAIALALENIRSGGGPFASVITRDGRFIAEGANRVTATNDPTAHAEVVAIREACRVLGAFQLTGCDLYTTCEPCPMCLGAIYWARPSRVFYAATDADAASAGFDDAFIYDELKRPHAARRIPMSQLLRDESLSIFAAWKNQANKTPY